MANDVLRKLVFITLAAMTAIGALIGVGFVQMERVFDGANAANVDAVPSLGVLGDMELDFLRIGNALTRHVLSEGGAKEAAETEVKAARSSFVADMNRYEKDGCLGATCAAGVQDSDYLRHERALWDRYSPLIDRVLVDSRRGGNGIDLARGSIAAADNLAREMQDTIEAHINVNIVQARESAAAAVRAKDSALVWQIALGSALVVGLAAVNYFMLRGLVGELKRLNVQLGGEPVDAMRAAQQLAAGDLDIALRLQQGDEHSVMASMQSIVGTMSRLADRADSIGKGELEAEVPLASNKDRLGLAINRMVNLLRHGREEERRRNWLKDGFAELSEALARDMHVQQVAETALSLVARYLGAGRGVVYLLSADAEQLELIASFMYTQRGRVGAQYKLGEGAVGQVARERKAIELQVTDDDVAPVVTGTTSQSPRFTHTYPLLHEQELLGVVELAGVNALDPLQREYLQAAASVLAASLYLAQQRWRVREMLAASEASELQMREQSAAISESNLRLEEQQQQLQQQTEELQQANSQMEEQQQQLQQQTEELQQSNAQLEETQSRLEQQNRDLEASRAEINQRASDLDQASRYKSEFLANMSHELRTPLNSIILLSKMLGQGPAPSEAEAQEWAQVINRSGNELLKLIDDVLDLAKVEAGRLDLQLAPLHSEELCGELRALFAPIAAEKGLKFTVDDGLHMMLLTDGQKLGQVLRNLLSNAMKFCKQGEVSLVLRRLPDQALPLRFTVIDTGIGIPADKQGLIFEAFAQADGSTSREYGGTGLGLTISQRMASLLGGRIELESKLGEGSAFTICLPDHAQGTDLRAMGPSESRWSESNPPVQDDRHCIASDDRTVLLVDDDDNFCKALIVLNRRKGYKTLVAGNGAEGLAMAQQYLPNAILLDLGLPDMDGAQVLHQLKTDRQLRDIPVYIVSARDRSEALLKEGAVGYLQKPASDDALLSIEARLLMQVRKASSRAQSERGKVLLLEGLSLSRDWLQAVLQHADLHVCGLNEDVQLFLTDVEPTLAVIDLAGRSTKQALALSDQLRQRLPGLPLIYYNDQSMSDEDEASLRRYSDSLILQSSQSQQRLLANVERFLSEVPVPSSGAADASSQRLAGRRILVTDDDPRNLFVIVAALEKNGAKVSTAVNGKKALEYLTLHEADLVLMDIMMPEMDGYQALEELRSQARWAQLPIVVLSAKALPADRAKVLAAGADDFLAKPVDYDALIDAAQRWCQGRG